MAHIVEPSTDEYHGLNQCMHLWGMRDKSQPCANQVVCFAATCPNAHCTPSTVLTPGKALKATNSSKNRRFPNSQQWIFQCRHQPQLDTNIECLCSSYGSQVVQTNRVSQGCIQIAKAISVSANCPTHNWRSIGSLTCNGKGGARR